MMTRVCKAFAFLLGCSALSRAMPAGACRCGADVGQAVVAVGPVSDVQFSRPDPLSITRENGKTVIEIAATVARDKVLTDVLLKSSDGGLSWISDGEYRQEWRGASNPAVVYSYQDKYLFSRSTDRGRHWVKPQFVVNGHSKEEFAQSVSGSTRSRLVVGLAAIHPKIAETLYATLSVWVYSNEKPGEKVYDVPGFYVSNDGGDHWSLFSSVVGNVGQGPDTRPALGISASDPNVMMAQAPTGVVRSSDGGKTWTAVGQQDDLNRRPELEGYADAIAEIKRKDPKFQPPKLEWLDLHVSYIRFRPDSSKVVYLVTNKGLYRTENGGDSWCRLDVRTRRLSSVGNLAFDPAEPNRIYVGTEKSILASSDGGCHFQRIFEWDEYESRQRHTSTKQAGRALPSPRTRPHTAWRSLTSRPQRPT